MLGIVIIVDGLFDFFLKVIYIVKLVKIYDDFKINILKLNLKVY